MYQTFAAVASKCRLGHAQNAQVEHIADNCDDALEKACDSGNDPIKWLDALNMQMAKPEKG